MELQGLKKIKEEMSLQKYRVPDMTIKEVRLSSSLKKRLLKKGLLKNFTFHFYTFSVHYFRYILLIVKNLFRLLI